MQSMSEIEDFWAWSEKIFVFSDIFNVNHRNVGNAKGISEHPKNFLVFQDVKNISEV